MKILNIWCIFSCNFRLDIRDFGKKCEIKGNKEKSRESGGSGQGKQPWEVGRYAVTDRRHSQLCTTVVHSELERGGASGNIRISQPGARSFSWSKV